MVFAARTTEKVDDLLPVLSLWHNVSSFPVSRTGTLIVLASCSEAVARSHASVACYRSTENVFVSAIVEPENKLVQVQREILPADAVIRTHDSALQQAPERFNGLSVDNATNVLSFAVVNDLVGILAVEPAIHSRVIRHEHGNVGNISNHVNEAFHGGHVRSVYHLANDVAFASDSANNGHFAGTARDSHALVAMPVLVLAANVSFVHFNDAHESGEVRISKASAEPVAHVPRGFVGTGILRSNRLHRSVDLERRDAFLGREHEMENLEPSQQGNIGVLKDRADKKREPVVFVVNVLFADPMEGLGAESLHPAVTATGTLDTLGPATRLKVTLAGFASREELVEFGDRELLCEGELLSLHERENTTGWVRCQVRDSPPGKEGCLRPKRFCEATLAEQTGWWINHKQRFFW